MKLMLTSKGLSSEALIQSFLALLAAKPEDTAVCIVTTAAIPHRSNHPRIQQAKELFLEIGVRIVDFLDVETDDPTRLYDYACIYIAGGNPVHLVNQMNRSDATRIIRTLANQNVLLIGVSAGTLALGPHLKVVNHFTPHLFNRVTDIDLTGVGLFDFPIMPHADREDIFPSDHPISVRIQHYEQTFNEQVVLLPDNEVLITDTIDGTFHRFG